MDWNALKAMRRAVVARVADEVGRLTQMEPREGFIFMLCFGFTIIVALFRVWLRLTVSGLRCWVEAIVRAVLVIPTIVIYLMIDIFIVSCWLIFEALGKVTGKK